MMYTSRRGESTRENPWEMQLLQQFKMEKFFRLAHSPLNLHAVIFSMLAEEQLFFVVTDSRVENWSQRECILQVQFTCHFWFVEGAGPVCCWSDPGVGDRSWHQRTCVFWAQTLLCLSPFASCSLSAKWILAYGYFNLIVLGFNTKDLKGFLKTYPMSISSIWFNYFSEQLLP